MLYSKPPLSVSEQLDRLASRGMAIPDRSRAERYLRHLGYYRLSAYWLPFEFPSESRGSRTHRFASDVDFDRIVDLDHLMVAIQPGTSWARRLRELLVRRTGQELEWMGFPPDWPSRRPWKESSSL